MISTGTKSLLWGVHNIVWHPITVARGWRRLYGKWPKGWEWIAILAHDIGYFGCNQMDDAKGEEHPILGACVVSRLYGFLQPLCFWKKYDERESYRREMELFFLIKYHSRYLSARDGFEPSKLCWADKMSPVFDPPWFYVLRARLSGEIKEYRANAGDRIPADWTDYQWFAWLRSKCEKDAIERRRATHRSFRYENDSTLR